MASVALSGTVYLLDEKTRLGQMDSKKKQVIIGILFGFLSILGTEMGIEMKGALINVRDAAPLCAGLIFGPRAGIIAGLMGGIERYFAVYWGAGSYTREACCAATIMAGFMAAFLRKYMFDNKRPAWFIGPFLAAVVEVFHMLMVFGIHIKDARGAFEVVQACAVPMIVLNGIAVWLAMATVSLLSAGGLHGLRKDIDQRELTAIIQRWLLVCINVVFVTSCFFTHVFQSNVSRSETDSILAQNLEDVKQDISDISDHNLLTITREVASVVEKELQKESKVSQELLEVIKVAEDVSEINYVNEEGIITVSTEPLFINYDMRSGEQSQEFLPLLDKKESVVQKYGPVSYSDSMYRKYAGVSLKEGGFIQVGYDAQRFQDDIDDIVSREANNRHVGENGFVVITNHDLDIISSYSEIDSIQTDSNQFAIDADTHPDAGQEEAFSLNVNGTIYRCMYDDVEGYNIFTLISDEEWKYDRDRTIYITIFMEVIVFSFLFVLIYILIKRMVVNNIV